MQRERVAYIGNVFVRDPEYARHWNYEQRKIFCPCGYATEFEPKYVTQQINKSDILYEWNQKSWDMREESTEDFDCVTCPNCETTYGHQSQLVELTGTKYGSNIMRRGMSYFVRDGKHALVCFLRQLIVSTVTRKLTFQNTRYAIYLNENTRRIYIKMPKTGIVCVGLRGLSNIVHNFLYKHTLSGYIGPSDNEIIAKDMFVGIDDFIAAIRKLVEPKDVDRLDKSLLIRTGGSNWYTSNIAIRQDLLVMYFACILYPPLATIAINKGADYLFDLLRCPLMCAPSVLKKSGATNLRDIVSSIVEHHLEKDARNKKYNQKIIAEYDNAQALYHATKDEKKRKKVSRAYFKLKKKKRHHLTFLNEKSWTKLEAKRDSQVPRTVLKIVSPEKIIDLVLQYVGSGCKIPLELLVTKFPVELLEFGFNYCTTLGDDRLLMQMMTLYQERKNDNYGGCSLYLDTFRMVKHMEIPYHELISCKTNDELKTYHDHLVTEYKLAKSEILIKKFEIISNVIVQFDCEIDGFKFEHIATPDEIINESFLMKHCISSYAHSVASGKYMAFRVTGPERATLGIHIINNMPTFDQLKAHCNKQCEEPARRATMKFFEKHNFKLSNVASDLIGNDEDLAIIGGLNGGTILEFKELIKENISLPEEAWLPF